MLSLNQESRWVRTPLSCPGTSQFLVLALRTYTWTGYSPAGSQVDTYLVIFLGHAYFSFFSVFKSAHTRKRNVGQIRRSRALQILSVDETKKTSNIVVLLVLLGKTKRHQSFWPALLLNMQETCANHRLKRLFLFFQSFSWPELFYPCNPKVKSRLVCFFSSFKI